MNERLVALTARLEQAQDEIAQARRERGESEQRILAAHRAAELDPAGDGDRYDVYLAELTRFVAALGGGVQVTAVFDDQEIIVRRDP